MDWSLLVCFKSQRILHIALKNKEEKLTQFHTRVKATAGAEQVQSRFSVVTLASPVNLSLRKHKQSSSMSVPLQLDLVTLEEALLRHRRTKLRYKEHFNCSGLSLLSKVVLLARNSTYGLNENSAVTTNLSLRNKNSNRLVLSG